MRETMETIIPARQSAMNEIDENEARKFVRRVADFISNDDYEVIGREFTYLKYTGMTVEATSIRITDQVTIDIKASTTIDTEETVQ